MRICKNCHSAVSQDEISLNYKMIRRNAQEFLCYKCLGIHFKVSEQLLKEKVAEYRKMGCGLFG